MPPRKKKGETSRVSVTIDRADRDFLERVANDQDRSVSWVAAHAIHLFVSQAKRSTSAIPGFEPPREDR